MSANGASTAQAALKVACSSCNLRELCTPAGLSEAEMARLDTLVSQRRTVARGDTLFANGQPLQALYAVRSGTFKTRLTNEQGHEQVFGFQMAGEVLGLDGIVEERHRCDAVALEDSIVCALTLQRLDTLAQEIPGLMRHMHKIMSREIVREHGVMQLLGGMRAEVRLASFLLNMAQRLGSRGFSSSEFVLRMTREEIGSYLGLKLETVSRTFSRLVEMGLIEVANRHVRITDADRLRDLTRC